LAFRWLPSTVWPGSAADVDENERPAEEAESFETHDGSSEPGSATAVEAPGAVTVGDIGMGDTPKAPVTRDWAMAAASSRPATSVDFGEPLLNRRSSFNTSSRPSPWMYCMT
jgi:hypothetical protein